MAADAPSFFTQETLENTLIKLGFEKERAPQLASAFLQENFNTVSALLNLSEADIKFFGLKRGDLAKLKGLEARAPAPGLFVSFFFFKFNLTGFLIFSVNFLTRAHFV
jgi:hypothetical protein